MFINTERAREIRTKIADSSGEGHVPARLVAGVATFLDGDDYALYAWRTSAPGRERWDAIAVVEGVLTHVEAENTSGDWIDGFDNENGFVRGRSVSCRNIQALEMLDQSGFAAYNGLEWDAAEWRVCLTDGSTIEPPRAKDDVSVKSLAVLIEKLTLALRHP